MNKKVKELCRFAYPVISSKFYDEVYMIPAVATKIWVRHKRHDGFAEFYIYADIGYESTTPMFCGRYGDIQFDLIVGDDYYLTDDKSIYEDLVWTEDCQEMAVMIAYQIARNGEVNCDVLDEYVSRVIFQRAKARYDNIKQKGGEK